MAVGMALGERWLAARFNRPKHQIIDHHTYVFAGTGNGGCDAGAGGPIRSIRKEKVRRDAEFMD